MIRQVVRSACKRLEGNDRDQPDDVLLLTAHTETHIEQDVQDSGFVSVDHWRYLVSCILQSDPQPTPYAQAAVRGTFT
jgi:hypothetical protein